MSLPVVAAYFEQEFSTTIVDLNQLTYSSRIIEEVVSAAEVFGLKVSSQNVHLAVEITEELRKKFPTALIIWGGEFPTLKASECMQYADCVFAGLIDRSITQFFSDYRANDAGGKIYKDTKADLTSARPAPRFSAYGESAEFLKFMGIPIETSYGCPFGCTFCMVHHMQPDGHVPKNYLQLERDVQQASGSFLNVVDYNIGASKEHFLEASKILGSSNCVGWMGEACLESLDDDEVLSSLRTSRCFAIYCGLETISEVGLKSIAKRQNIVGEYRRIIRKAQSYGIQIASGVILGLPGQTRNDLITTMRFFEELGLLYIKLTFLTYNPGTTIYRMMSRKGVYRGTSNSLFDGNHLSFLPQGVDAKEVYQGAEELINNFYSLGSLWRRSAHLADTPMKRVEFMVFSHLYSQAYRLWQKFDVLTPNAGQFERLLRSRFTKDINTRVFEVLLSWLRRKNRGQLPADDRFRDGEVTAEAWRTSESV